MAFPFIPRLWVVGLVAGASLHGASNGRVLFVHDSATAAQPLIQYLQTKGSLEVTVVDQAHLPSSWGDYRAVLGYIHGALKEPTELAIIEYTKNGGRFIALHHMISSGKADNKYYFDFLGVRLDNPKASRNPVTPGGDYGWYTGTNSGSAGESGITYTLVKLHPTHYIVTHEVSWGAPVNYQPSDPLAVAGEFPAIVLDKAEAYMNHKFTDGCAKTILCGMKYTDPRTHAVFEQDRMAWYKDYGKGRIFYFQPGHFAEEYANSAISQMVLNAIVWDGR